MNNIERDLKSNESAPDTTTERKPFVEPTISQPQDVLEATKFFQTPIDSGRQPT